MKLPSRIVEVMRGVGGAALIAAAATVATGCAARAQAANEEPTVAANRSGSAAAKNELETAQAQGGSSATQHGQGQSSTTTSHGQSEPYDEVPPPCGRG